ncbi:MAG: HEPN domain-containing protein [Candidatus Binatales bacterium]
MKAFTRAQCCPQDLLQAAMDHLRSAKVLFDRHPCCYDSAGYLTHLGLELIFKAWLLDEVGRFDAEHSLKVLRESIQSAGIELSLRQDHVELLNKLDDFGALRYPGLNKSPSIGNRDWEHTEVLLEWIFGRMPSALQECIRSIDATRKSGRILLKKPKPRLSRPLASS